MTEEVARTMWAAKQIGDIIPIARKTSTSLTTVTPTSTDSIDVTERILHGSALPHNTYPYPTQ